MRPIVIELRDEDWIGNYPVKVEQLVLRNHEGDGPCCER